MNLFLFYVYLFTFFTLIFQKFIRRPLLIQVKKKWNLFLGMIVKYKARILIKILHDDICSVFLINL